MKIEMWYYHLCKCTVQRAETAGRVGKQVHTVAMSKDLKYSNGSVATKKFQTFVHTCEDMIAVDWAIGSSANESRFGPKYSMTQKPHSSLGRPTQGC